MKIETWVAVAVVGLSIMFDVLLISLFNFLIGPDGQGPQRVVDPQGLLVQQISVSGAPAFVLAGIALGMAKNYGSKPAGILLVVAGIIIMAGMSYASMLIPKIDPQYVVPGLPELIYIFIGGGAAVAGIGGFLLARSRRRIKSISDDLR